MLKTIEDRVGEGFVPKRILYFSFDELAGEEIREILKEYCTLVETDLDEGAHLIFLDEIQKLEGWENQLKALYDRFRKKIRFVISGSESLFIRREFHETLAGRLFEFQVSPLSYREYLNFIDAKFEPLDFHERELSSSFDDFLLTQGFLELVGVKEKAVLKRYVQDSVIDRVVFRDLPVLVGLKNIAVIRSLFNIFMEEPGQIVRLSELAGQLGVTRQTLSYYLSYLEDSFLIRKLYNYSPSRTKVERKLKRYFPIVVSVDLLFKDDDLPRSRVFKWAVVNQLRAEFFWRDPYKHEVDVVLMNGGPVPIEVKYGKTNFKGLRAFMRKYHVAEGYTVTPTTEDCVEDDGKTIEVVPAYKFLLQRSAWVNRS